MLRRALPESCALTLEAALACRRGRALDVARIAKRLGYGRGSALAALDGLDAAFRTAFGVRMFPVRLATCPRPDEGMVAASDRDESTTDGDGASVPGPAAMDAPMLSMDFVDLLERSPEPARPAGPAPEAGGDVATWIAALASASDREPGLHLALRCRGDGGRGPDDLVALLHDVGVATYRVDGDGRELACAMLQADLHLGRRRAVVVIGPGRLLEDRSADDGWDREPARAAQAGPTSFVRGALAWLAAMRTSCVWCVDSDVVVPPALDGLIAGCIGPIRLTDVAARLHIEAALGSGVGASGVAAIAATMADARDVGARAAAVGCLRDAGLTVDAACAALARSLMPDYDAPPAAFAFDLGLHAHEVDVAAMFARAGEIAQGGGRLLFHGPSGGGKSTICRALALRMAEAGAAGPALVVSAAALLARAYGATERLLETLWRRAEIARAPLIVDEIDAMCGVRDPSSSSGNAYLVRVLTDEWLKRFDAHPGVVVLATCNDLRAVDPAVLRRFDGQHAIGDRLPPALERRAWDTILGVAPPAGWTPCGAAPSDFATALKRCRMLGLLDPASLSRAVERARDARCGPRAPRRATPGPVH